MSINLTKPDGKGKSARANKRIDYLTALTSLNRIVEALLDFIKHNRDEILSNPNSQDLLNVYLFLEQNRESAANKKD